MPRKIISHIKRTFKTSSARETLSFRIVIMDEHGKALVEVEQYTLRKIDLNVFSKSKSIGKKFMRIVQQVVKSCKISNKEIKFDLNPISEYFSLGLSG